MRRAVITEPSIEPDVLSAPKMIPKSDETARVIMKALQSHYLFDSLGDDEVKDILMAMSHVLQPPHSDVIIQGTPGNCFYVLETGKAAIYVNDELVGTYHSGDVFGELALLYNCPRAATIRTLTTCSLWSVDRVCFRKILATAASTMQLQRVQFLKHVDLLSKLNSDQLQKVAAAMHVETFADNAYIIRQGEEGHSFYIVADGTVLCTTVTFGQGEKPLMCLEKGQYFGEMALMLNEPRQANCIAKGNVTCYVLGRAEFTSLLGPLRTVLDRHMRIRVLRTVPLLNFLTDDELDVLAHALRVTSFEDKQMIIREGDPGETFYIINEGRVRVSKSGVDIMTLSSGEFFGERALLTNEPRAADCVAVGSVELLCLDRSSFEQLLGTLEHILLRETKRQQMMMQAQATIAALPTSPTSSSVAAATTITSCSKAKVSYRLEELETRHVLGAGTFGRVVLVQHRPTQQWFALKCMTKVNIVETNQQRNVMTEKSILRACNHPFILKLVETFQDRNQLYMLLELVQGGELWSLLYEKPHLNLVPKGASGAFDNYSARFYGANVIHCLHYLQTLGVAYRDLKPENLMVDNDGYLKMVDFGFAKHIPFYKDGRTSEICERSFTLCGTPEYLAPELVLNKGHGQGVDHWALGCLLYELLAGRTPFQHNDQQKMFEKIIHAKNHLRFPATFEPMAKDLITKLLEPHAGMRLGTRTTPSPDPITIPLILHSRRRLVGWRHE